MSVAACGTRSRVASPQPTTAATSTIAPGTGNPRMVSASPPPPARNAASVQSSGRLSKPYATTRSQASLAAAVAMIGTAGPGRTTAGRDGLIRACQEGAGPARLSPGADGADWGEYAHAPEPPRPAARAGASSQLRSGPGSRR